jgi:hypothetical protein
MNIAPIAFCIWHPPGSCVHVPHQRTHFSIARHGDLGKSDQNVIQRTSFYACNFGALLLWRSSDLQSRCQWSL